MDAMIARYIELGEEISIEKKKMNLMNREKKVLEEKIQDGLKATGQTEIVSNDNTLCIRIKEKKRKRGPTRDEMIDSIAQETGYFFDNDKLEQMQRETIVTNLQVVNKRPR